MGVERTEYYDRLEVRDPEEREVALFVALPGLLRHAIENAPAMARLLDGVEPDQICDRAALARLPVVRRADVLAAQRADPPYGGFAGTPTDRLSRLYCGEDEVFAPEGARRDYWRTARAFWAAGARRGAAVMNGFRHSLSPLGPMFESGARALGCPVAPAGGAPIARQVAAARALAPSIFVGARRDLDALLAALGEGSPFARALLRVEPGDDADAAALARAHGIAARRCHVSPAIGLIAYETEAVDGLVLDESLILELVEPGGAAPVAPGDVGEVVVTLFNPDFPLIRYGTGDLAVLMKGSSPCGRTNARLALASGSAAPGVALDAGRLFPHQIEALGAGFPEIDRVACLIERVDGEERLLLAIELGAPAEGLPARLARRARDETGFAFEVEARAVGALAAEGFAADEVVRDLRRRHV